MSGLIKLSLWIDTLNDRFAWFAKWAVFASCFISAGNAIVRYVFNYSSTGGFLLPRRQVLQKARALRKL